jgi:hypothetical protein
MPKTLLQIISTAQGELGLAQALSVVGNTDTTTVQMFTLLNSELEELRKRHNWTVLRTEYNIVVSPPLETTGNTLLNSAVISNLASTSGLSARDFMVTGSGIPVGARVISIDSATQVTMNMVATGTNISTDLVFAKDSYPLPSDFHCYENRTWWDRTNRWELLGPDSPQISQWHLSGIVTTGPRRHFRQIGPYANRYRLWPPPAEITEVLQLAFEYISNSCVFVNASPTSFASQFANDADTPILDDRALIMGLKYRFWAQKGFNWASLRTDYDNYVDRLIAQDGGAPTLSMVARKAPILVDSAQVQDGFFPGPTGPNMS